MDATNRIIDDAYSWGDVVEYLGRLSAQAQIGTSDKPFIQINKSELAITYGRAIRLLNGPAIDGDPVDGEQRAEYD